MHIRYRISYAVVLILTWFILTIGAASADTPITWQEYLVTVETQLMPIEGLPGRSVGILEQRGFAHMAEGELATLRVWLSFERQGATSAYFGHAVYRYPDGSSKFARFEGASNPGGAQTGLFELVAGTGRFEGITGGGSFSGQSYPPYGDVFIEVQGSYSLQSR